MDCEMRPSDELMEFSVSALWDTCTSKVLIAATASLYGATVTVRAGIESSLLPEFQAYWHAPLNAHTSCHNQRCYHTLHPD